MVCGHGTFKKQAVVLSTKYTLQNNLRSNTCTILLQPVNLGVLFTGHRMITKFCTMGTDTDGTENPRKPADTETQSGNKSDLKTSIE